jgi:TPR repeat protein
MVRLGFSLTIILGAAFLNAQSGIDPKILDEANAGVVTSQEIVALFYQLGTGVKADPAEAAKWFRKAAEQGNAFSMDRLGEHYRDGQGVPQDYAQAALWFQKAADLRDLDGERDLALLYFKGLGVPKSPTDGIKWMRKAADGGLADAQYRLGMSYKIGFGVPQDYSEAYFWLNLAVASGLDSDTQKSAFENRVEVEKRLTPERLADVQASCMRWAAEHPARGASAP